jgi:hypothetical protein
MTIRNSFSAYWLDYPARQLHHRSDHARRIDHNRGLDLRRILDDWSDERRHHFRLRRHQRQVR